MQGAHASDWLWYDVRFRNLPSHKEHKPFHLGLHSPRVEKQLWKLAQTQQPERAERGQLKIPKWLTRLLYKVCVMVWISSQRSLHSLRPPPAQIL